MSKIMRQLVAEGRVARDKLVKRKPDLEPEPEPTQPVCPKTGFNCLRTPPCTGICLDAMPHAIDPNVSDGAWPYIGDSDA